MSVWTGSSYNCSSCVCASRSAELHPTVNSACDLICSMSWIIFICTAYVRRVSLENTFFCVFLIVLNKFNVIASKHLILTSLQGKEKPVSSTSDKTVIANHLN